MNNQNNNQNNGDNNGFFNKNPIFIFAIFAIVIVLAFRSFGGDGLGGSFGVGNNAQNKMVAYSEFKDMLKNKQLNEVAISETTIKGVGGDKTIYLSKRLNDPTLINLLEQNGITYSVYSENNWFGDLLFSWIIPVFIFFAIWMFIASRMQKNIGGGILGIGSAKKLINSEKPKVKFDDVAGVEEAKEEVQEIVDYLKSPDKYLRLGAKIPKGILLVGPPGTGKTLIAKATAGEANVPFFFISASNFVEMFVGLGAKRVRDMFEEARQNAPAIIFIDELDAVGRSRGAGIGGGNDEREQTLNQLLVEMDGIKENSGILIMAATNRTDVLDPALLRPGRFDRIITVSLPDIKEREEILKLHAKGKRIDPNVKFNLIARRTPGFSGAQLENVINEATLLSVRENTKLITLAQIDEAIDRVMAGPAKKSRAISEKENIAVAYH
uniref:ATP-dependent metallopeptidase FtsH/Yme1/Tma family protein n=1 Tax=uncultured Campylobacter sp. TaxID=218934 RepID=UPI0026083984